MPGRDHKQCILTIGLSIIATEYVEQDVVAAAPLEAVRSSTGNVNVDACKWQARAENDSVLIMSSLAHFSGPIGRRNW